MVTLRIPDPIPQVGAILDLDTELPDDGDRFTLGDKHWQLNGSCVLMAPDRLLTLRHVLENRNRAAAFFPYEGFFELSAESDDESERQPFGDNLMLVRLKSSLKYSPPLHPKYIKEYYKDGGYAEICGYGAWSGTSFDGAPGVQSRLRVELGPPAPNSGIQRLRCDNLDLCWSAFANGGVKAGHGNSGGPLLWDSHDGWKVVGLSRETKGDQQIASYITKQRREWLSPLSEIPSPGLVPATFESSLRKVDEAGITLEIEVPAGGADWVQATLSASPGLRLQMGIEPGNAASSEQLLQGLRQEPKAAGSFLFRSRSLPTDTKVITVGVVPYAGAPRKARYVQAQVSVLFKSGQ